MTTSATTNCRDLRLGIHCTLAEPFVLELLSLLSVDCYDTDRTCSRYFMFHAALIPAVCICANQTSPDAVSWKADIDTTRALLALAFSSNTLASRCLEVLNRLIPQAASDADDFQSSPAEVNAGMEDFLSWPSDSVDPINFLGWPD